MYMKVILCAQLGRLEEARECLSQLREAQPGLTIAWYKARFATEWLAPQIAGFYVDGLRKAGLPDE